MHGQSDDELCYVHIESIKAREERVCSLGLVVLICLIVLKNLTE